MVPSVTLAQSVKKLWSLKGFPATTVAGAGVKVFVCFVVINKSKAFFQVMDALDYLQSLRIVHCDVKPRNVVLSSDHQRCFLTDFGEARYIPFSKPYFQLKSELVGTLNSTGIKVPCCNLRLSFIRRIQRPIVAAR